MNLSIEDLIDKIGHDGSDILWPELPEPVKRKSFHIEEIQYAARFYGFAFASYVSGFSYWPDEMQPFVQQGARLHTELHDFTERMNDVITLMDGILLGRHVDSKANHAVAWDHTEEKIYDPSGTTYARDKFVPELFYGLLTPYRPSKKSRV